MKILFISLLSLFVISSVSLAAKNISVDPAVRSAVRTQKTVEVFVKLHSRNHSFGQHSPSNAKNSTRANVFSQNLKQILQAAAEKSQQPVSEIQVLALAPNIGVAQIIAPSATVRALISLGSIDAIELKE